MSELRSAIESLRAEPLDMLPDVRLDEDFSELNAAVELLGGAGTNRHRWR